MATTITTILKRIPRQPLADFPTPLLPAQRLSDTLDGATLWFKRDDLISFGLGGNKVRGLEVLLADALAKRADTLVTGAGPQSNHVRATAAAAAVCGMDCSTLAWGEPPAVVDGNYRVTRMLGASVTFTGQNERASVDIAIAEAAQRLRDDGHTPYSIPRAGACALGALGHVLAASEFETQCAALSLRPDALVIAAGSGCTYAGWLLGRKLLRAQWNIECFTVSRDAVEVSQQSARLATEAALLLGLDFKFEPDDAPVHDGFIGAGYGVPTAAGTEAIKLVARTEGVLLDPTYTGKAMAGYLALERQQVYNANDTVVFMHTGGEPAFFAGDGAWLN
ncbi:MAG: 1-aminocyclopropane-1-carboxylate deaminase/D-cysteine desulfhydrase [Pseudomonadales bacterium]